MATFSAGIHNRASSGYNPSNPAKNIDFVSMQNLSKKIDKKKGNEYMANYS
jgi:hypothetical protein